MKTAAELMELIPYETARRAHYWTSFTPDERGKQVQENFAATIINLFEKIKMLDETRVDEIKIDIEKFIQIYRNKTLSWLTSKGRTASAAITGGANFNYDRNNKRMEVEHRKNSEIVELIQRTEKALIKKYKQVKETDIQAEFEDYHKTINTGHYSIDLIKKGLERKLLKEVKEGRGQEVMEALAKDNYKVFTKRHSIYKNIEKLMEVKATEQTTSETINGIKIIDNIELNRILLIFEGKPNEDIRKYLKSHAWKWSPRNNAWQNFRKMERLQQIKNYIKELKNDDQI